MKSALAKPTPNPKRESLRVLRPLQWWFLLVLALFAYRTHLRLSEKTRLAFSVEFQGNVLLSPTTTVDGRRFTSGDRLSLGRHALSISETKADSFDTNLFIWYGAHDLGAIHLRRATGVLRIAAHPKASTLSVVGPEFRIRLTNSFGLTSSVPTDIYSINARYAHTNESADVVVGANAGASIAVGSKLGTLRITSDQPDVRFSLYSSSGTERVTDGRLPSTIEELPEGKYTIRAHCKDDEQTRLIEVKPQQVVDSRIEFVYGNLRIETDPPGAHVSKGEIRLGITPLFLSSLEPGKLQLTLSRRSYDDVQLSVEVLGNQTNLIRTSLTNRLYPEALKRIRYEIESTNLEGTISALREAYDNQPYSPGHDSGETPWTKDIAAVQKLAMANEYEMAWSNVEVLLRTLPPKGLPEPTAALECRKQEGRAQEIREQSERIKALYESILTRVPFSEPFNTSELEVQGEPEGTKNTLTNVLATMEPQFEITRCDSPVKDCFVIDAQQNVAGGRRRCIIVGGKKQPRTMLLYFKVLELLTPTAGVTDWVSIIDSRSDELTPEKDLRIRIGIEVLKKRLGALRR